MIQSWYTAVKAPFGHLYVVAEKDRIVRIRPEKPPCIPVCRRDSMPLLAHAADELKAYFEGRCKTVSLPFPTDLPPFSDVVYTRIAHIPYGDTLDARRLCRDCGYSHALHAVRMLCVANPFWVIVPCHRIRFPPLYEDPSHPLKAEDVLRKMEKRYADTLTKPPKEGKL